MKLAEALQERADINRKIDQLKNRLVLNATAQEGEGPAEDPCKLLAELDICVDRLENLMSRINLTNCNTVICTKTLTEHIARKDALALRLMAYRELVNSASQIARRATRSEIKIVSTVSVPEKQKIADDIAKEIRNIDNLLQSANWTTELM